MLVRQLLLGISLATVGSCADAQQLPAMTEQTQNIKRTPLRTIEFPSGFTTITAMAEMSAGNCIGRHTHPGIETAYVLEGDIVLKVDGKPEQAFKAGGSFENSPNTPHDACTVSGFKVLVTYVVEKGKPLSSPAQ